MSTLFTYNKKFLYKILDIIVSILLTRNFFNQDFFFEKGHLTLIFL